jgi:hypothetical protein
MGETDAMLLNGRTADPDQLRVLNGARDEYVG